MKALAVILLFVSLCANATVRLNQFGRGLIKNYAPSEYKADDRNRAIVQDSRGIIYVANDGGVLEYDGSTWNLIHVNDKSYATALAVSDDDDIFVGAVNDFGVLRNDSLGRLHFESLFLPYKRNIKFGAIQSIYCAEDLIYFCCHDYIFVFENGHWTATWPLHEGSFKSFWIGGEIWTANRQIGLSRVNYNGMTPIEGCENLKQFVSAIYPKSKSELLIFTNNSVLVYNTKTKKLREETRTDELFQLLNLEPHTFIFDVERLSNKQYVLTSLNSTKHSVLVVDTAFNLINVFNTEIGMRDSNCVDLYSRDGRIIWCALNSGISRLEITDVGLFGNESGIEGAITDICEHEGVIYFSTPKGVYRQVTTPSGKVEFVRVNIKEDIHCLLNFIDHKEGKEILLAAGSRHTYEVRGERDVTPYDNAHGLAFCMFQSRCVNNRLMLGTEGALVVYRLKNGSWLFEKSIDGVVRKEISDIEEDADGNIWFCANNEGVFRWGRDGKVKRFDNSSGLLSLSKLSLSLLDSNLVVCNEKGVFRFLKDKNRFTPFSNSGSDLSGIINVNINWTTKGFARIEELKGGYVAISHVEESPNTISLILRDEDWSWQETSQPFARLPHSLNTVILKDSKDHLWIGLPGELYCYRTPDVAGSLVYDDVEQQLGSFNTLIRQIAIGDSIVHYGNTNASAILGKNIKYDDNRLMFRYSATCYFDEMLTVYSTMLEGWEKGWTDWSNSNTSVYNNLPEGEYTFKVKAKNVYGVVSETTSFSFTIDPPVYRTWWAFTIYILVGSLLIIAAIRVHTVRLRREKTRLEYLVSMRTSELELKNYQNELQKHEIEHQKEHIEEQNKGIMQSIQYASLIQQAVLPPEDVMAKIFPEHFLVYLPRDVVSGDFYWMREVGNRKICALGDCTGHGVPGGFMSMLGISMLNQIIAWEHRPAHILDKLRESVITSLRQTGRIGENRDGMDIAVISINKENLELEFAGGNSRILVARGVDIFTLQGDRMAVGFGSHNDTPFQCQTFQLKHGDIIYLFTDGYYDQFGGDDNRKLLFRHFRNLIQATCTFPLMEQYSILLTHQIDWQGNNEQTDDITVLAIKV